MRLLLLRHAESQHGRLRIIAGERSCPGLTATGFERALTLSAQLRDSAELADCVALLSSPVLRACQTAAALASALPGLTVEHDCGLCEVHPGDADGLTRDEYRSRYGEVDLVATPTQRFAPGGENWHEFMERVESTLARLASRFAGKRVLAVTHAGFIVASVLVQFAIPRPGSGAQLQTDNLRFTEWHVSAGCWHLVRFNHAWPLHDSQNDPSDTKPRESLHRDSKL